jgi:hypothetical protein
MKNSRIFLLAGMMLTAVNMSVASENPFNNPTNALQLQLSGANNPLKPEILQELILGGGVEHFETPKKNTVRIGLFIETSPETLLVIMKALFNDSAVKKETDSTDELSTELNK